MIILYLVKISFCVRFQLGFFCVIRKQILKKKITIEKTGDLFDLGMLREGANGGLLPIFKSLIYFVLHIIGYHV
jgi:hypothetical protein